MEQREEIEIVFVLDGNEIIWLFDKGATLDSLRGMLVTTKHYWPPSILPVRDYWIERIRVAQHWFVNGVEQSRSYELKNEDVVEIK